MGEHAEVVVYKLTDLPAFPFPKVCTTHTSRSLVSPPRPPPSCLRRNRQSRWVGFKLQTDLDKFIH